MKVHKIIYLFVLLYFFCQNSFADNRAGAFVISPSIGPYLFNADRGVKNNAMYNLGLGYDFNRNWAIEALAGTAPTNLKNTNQNIRANFYSIDGVYHFSTNVPLVPYVLAGAGVLDFNNNQTQLDTQTNVNAGAGLEYFLGNSFALRSDVRDIYTVGSGKSDLLVNFGVSLLLGGNKQQTSSSLYQNASCLGTNLVVRYGNGAVNADPIYLAELQQMVNCLQNNPHLKINLDGYAHCMKNSQENLSLSQQRANNLKEYLIEQVGINPLRINTQGFGEANLADEVVVSLYGREGA